MKRRTFIKFSTITTIIFTTSIALSRTIQKDTLYILDEVLNIIFPKTSTMPSAKEFNALNYLLQNISHKTFDNDDKVLILDGAKDFLAAFSDFLNLDDKEKKELIFRIIKTNSYAKSWVSKLSYYGIEAMFSDPIYGGNSNQIGWISVNHSVGYPRPLKTYGHRI